MRSPAPRLPSNATLSVSCEAILAREWLRRLGVSCGEHAFCSARRGALAGLGSIAQAGTAAAAAQRDGCPREQDAKVENLHVDAAAILPHGSDGSGGAGLDHRKR